MSDDANQIADHLIGQHGIDGALETARDGITAAHAKGDNYRLSVWREVKRILQDNQAVTDNHEEANE